MMQKHKRAPGAGRKPKGNFSRLSSVLTVRMPDQMRKRLAAAAKKRPAGGWSVSQELLHRVQRSFDRERDERRDPATRALCYLLAEVISMATTVLPNRDWRSDPFVFRSISLAFTQLLAALEPEGDIQPPPLEDEPFSGWHGDFGPAGKTPEGTGGMIYQLMMLWLGGKTKPELYRMMVKWGTAP